MQKRDNSLPRSLRGGTRIVIAVVLVASCGLLGLPVEYEDLSGRYSGSWQGASGDLSLLATVDGTLDQTDQHLTGTLHWEGQLSDGTMSIDAHGEVFLDGEVGEGDDPRVFLTSTNYPQCEVNGEYSGNFDSQTETLVMSGRDEWLDESCWPLELFTINVILTRYGRAN